MIYLKKKCNIVQKRDNIKIKQIQVQNIETIDEHDEKYQSFKWLVMYQDNVLIIFQTFLGHSSVPNNISTVVSYSRKLQTDIISFVPWDYSIFFTCQQSKKNDNYILQTTNLHDDTIHQLTQIYLHSNQWITQILPSKYYVNRVYLLTKTSTNNIELKMLEIENNKGVNEETLMLFTSKQRDISVEESQYNHFLYIFFGKLIMSIRPPQ